ncbi:MAG: hypothetical protein WKF93_11545 [Acidimicrobiales bacterium]
MADVLVVQRNAAGVVPGPPRPAYATVEAAKASAMRRNKGRRNPLVWWAVADAAGTPLDPQP